MRLSQIQKRYITEGWNDPEMLLLEQKVIEPFVSNVERIVLEASLTADQINQLFTSIEKGATDAGDNRTAIGKGTDAVKNTAGAIKAEIDKLGAAIKSAGPVQNMDAKFNELKQKIGDKDSKVVSAVKAVSDWAKENPGKASVAVAILTAAAALAAGPLGGLVGGFLGRATKDILQGKDLSTAVGKSALTGIAGAGIGAGIELIGDLVDPDVAQTLIASDGQSIDVGALEGMKATSIENLAPEAAEDLLKTQNALETALKNLSGEELEVFQAEFEEVSAKINELGGRDALADHAGLEGQDLQRDTTTTTDVGVDKSGDPSAGADGPGGDSPDAGATDASTVETVKAEPVSADQLKKAGINFDAEPDIAPEVAEWAKSKGIDPDQLQKMFQMEKGMADAEFMGQSISANESSAMSWTGDAPELGTTTLPDGAEIKVGDQFKSEVSTSVGGIEPPIKFTSSVTIEGVDANGDPVFVVQEVTTQPTHPVWDAIDKANLSDEDAEKLFQFMNEYTGVSADSKAGISVVVDTFKQDLAKSIGAAASAVAMSVALQDKKVVPANAEPAQESIDYKVKRLSEGQIYMLFNRIEKVNTHMLESKLMFESVFDAVAHYNRQTINEAEPAVAEPEAEKKPGLLSKIGGKIKQGAKTAASAIGGAAKQITTKVTAEKLNRQWKEAGSPTDSAEIYDILKKAGVNDDVIKGTYDSMKIEVPAATDAPDGDQDPGAADAETNADAPTDGTAGDGGSDTTDTGAADANAGGDDPAATDDGPVDTDPTTPGVQEKDKQFIMVQDPKDKTKYNVVDSETQKVVDGGAGLDAGAADEMRDTKNAEVVSQKQAADGATDTDTASASGDDAQTGTTDTQTDTTTAQGTDSTATDTATSSNTTSQTDTTSSDKSATSDQSATSDKSSDQTNTSTTSTSTSSNQGSSGEGGGSNTSTDSSTTTTTSNQASANNQASSSNQASNSQQATSQTSSTKVDVKTVAKNIKTAGPKVTMDVRAALEKEVKAA